MESRAPDIRVEFIFFIILTILAVALRFASRVLHRTKFWWDDWCVLIALPLCLALSAVYLRQVDLGLGQHVDTYAASDSSKRLPIDFACKIMYLVALTPAKLAALFYYCRVLGYRSRQSQYLKVSVWIAGVLCVIWFVQGILSVFLSCHPAIKAVYPTTQGYCTTQKGALATISLNVIIDVIILLIPMPIILRIQATWRRKIGVAIIFLSGYLVLAISIARLATSAVSQSGNNDDPSWSEATISELTGAEPNVCLISVCLPDIIALLRHLATHGPRRKDVAEVNVSPTTTSGGTLGIRSEKHTYNDKERDSTDRLYGRPIRNIENMDNYSRSTLTAPAPIVTRPELPRTESTAYHPDSGSDDSVFRESLPPDRVLVRSDVYLDV